MTNEKQLPRPFPLHEFKKIDLTILKGVVISSCVVAGLSVILVGLRLGGIL